MTGRKPGSGKGGFDFTDDDRRVWREVTKEYNKLPTATVPLEVVSPAPKSPKEKAEHVSLPLLPIKKNLPSLVPGTGDTRSFKQVRKSPKALEAVLDLHGYTESAAHTALIRFLSRCSAEDKRLVRVITGKGRGGEGKLRRAILEWLNLPELRGFVVSCAHAPSRQGGEGALDLVLRKRK